MLFGIPFCGKISLWQLMAMDNWEKVRQRIRSKTGFREIKKADYSGMTALFRACGFSTPSDIVQYLIDLQPENLTRCSLIGKLPLHEACTYMMSLDIVQLLLKQKKCAKLQVLGQDRSGKTPLHCAVLSACQTSCELSTKLQVIETLCRVAPEAINIKDHRGERPINIAYRLYSRNATIVFHYLQDISSHYNIQSNGAYISNPINFDSCAAPLT